MRGKPHLALLVLATACSSDAGAEDASSTLPAGDASTSSTGSEMGGTSSDGTSSDTATTETSTTSTTSEESSATTGSQAGCAARNADFECGPIDCADPIYQFECGGTNMFDDEGCLRAWCHEDDECDDGERCYSPAFCGEPTCDTFAGCDMLDDECICTFLGGCEDPPPTDPRGWCIPGEAFPC